MPNTTNFNWNTPADTDLVKDGAAAIRTLGNNIDASLVDLKGGTTGQVLAKATNTDLDFTWVAQDDSNAIQNAIVDAKGDLITATAADTPARLAVGTNGQYLQADSTTATGLKWASVSAGGMTQLATGSLTGSSVTLSNISADYIHLQLVINGFRPSNSSFSQLYARLNNDSNARYATFSLNNGENVGFNDTQIDCSGAQNTTTSNSLIILDVPNYKNTTTWKSLISDTISNNQTTSTNVNRAGLRGIYNQTAAIDSITLLVVAGTFSAGTYTLYGVK